MFQKKNKIFSFVKWLIMLLAYGFLTYKLAHIEYWDELKATFSKLNFERIIFLLVVLVLMPLNWAMETLKWQLLCKKHITLPFRTALKAVLAGLSTGYISPNRIGDFAGRILFLPSNLRVAGVFFSVLNSISQNIILTLWGVIAAIIFFSNHQFNINPQSYLLAVSSGILIIVALYFAFPSISKKIKYENWSDKIKISILSFSRFKISELLSILGISVLRYSVFCFQFYLMLCFFSIDISFFQACIAIPTMYLLITFTPSFAAAEPAIRGSAADLIFGVYSNNEIGIILTGILIWIINFVLPMLVGSILMGATKSTEE